MISAYTHPLKSGILGKKAYVLGTSALVGAAIGIILWVGNPQHSLVDGILTAGYIGLCIGVAGMAGMMISRSGLATLSSSRKSYALALILFLAGVLGWYLAFVTLPLVSFRTLRISTFDWRVALLFSGSLSMCTGFVILVYYRLRVRLEESLKRVQEEELATRELEMAREIQRSLLPPPLVENENYRIAARNHASRVVAGDFYDLIPRRDGRIVLVVGDVSGKGLGASLVMATVKAMIPLIADSCDDASAILVALNDKLVEILGPRQFVALACVNYDPHSGEIEIANAGLPDPYLITPEGLATSVEIDGPRLPLGLKRDLSYHCSKGVLTPGQRLLLLTDGLPEAMNESGEPLGYDHLADLLEGPTDEVESWLDHLFVEVERRASIAEDDRTALVVEHRRSGAIG